jgi:ribonuclease-3
MGPAAELADRLGLALPNLDLLAQALVHSSYLHEHPDAAPGHNERLEYLGDAVVNLAFSEALFRQHPDEDEGSLSARRAALVSTAGLARLAGRLDLGAALLLGEGEVARGGRRRPSLLAQAFEALVGALYLQLGFEATRDWLLRLAGTDLAGQPSPGSLKSPKSRLQELTQHRSGARPVYRLVEAVGPDHEKVFRVEVVVDGVVVGRGEGPSRRVAETAAAEEALTTLAARVGGSPEATASAVATPTGARPSDAGGADPVEEGGR